MKVIDIFNFLNEKFPISTACDFDNVGILVGDPQCGVNAAVVALDCTSSVIETAVKNSAQLIITHHPVIFDPLKSVTAGSIVYELIKNELSVISMHTNLDVGIGGVNDALSNVLSLVNTKKVSTDDGYLLNVGENETPLSPDGFASFLKERLGGTVKYTAGKRAVKKVLLCSGSGGGYLKEAVKFGCDAFVTADIKHNVFLDAEHLGISLYDAGHFNTENIVAEPLKNMLAKKFPEIRFIADCSTGIYFK